MKRLLLTTICLFMLAMSPSAIYAQEETPEPIVATEIPADVQSMIDTAVAQALAAQDEQLEEIRDAESRALSYLSVFEAIGTVISLLTIAVPLLIAFGGLQLYRRVVNSVRDMEKELAEIRQARARSEQTEQQLRERIEHVDQLSHHVNTEFKRFHEALSLLSSAEKQYHAGDLIGALNTYERALSLDPENPVTLYHAAYIYTQQNDLEKAEEYLEHALSLDPSYDHARAALGFVYRRIGEKNQNANVRDQLFEKSRQFLEQALSNSHRLVDDDGESWYGALAGLYRRQGKLEDAQYYYKKAAEITPHSSYPVLNLAMLTLQSGGDNYGPLFSRVERLAKMEIQAELNNYWGYGDLLTAQLVLGKFEEARQTATDLIETIPPSVRDVMPRIRDTLQVLSDRLERLEDYTLSQNILQIRDMIKYLVENS